ncbi:MAG: hypothetical protein AB4426_02975 [Xenococcaceae cyanobacterium]
MAEGLTAEQVYNRVQALYNQRAEEYFERGDFDTYKYLALDSRHLRAPSVDERWGDTQARFE